jgi:hypothetical protein
VRWAAALLVLAGCADQGAQPWDLEHDRVIAVRATPPRAVPGERVVLDALVTTVEGGPAEVVPSELTLPPATVESLRGVVDDVEVVCPDDALLQVARVELGLDADAPVPLTVIVAAPVGDEVRAAIKTVWFGDVGANPAIGEIRVTGEPAVGVELELAIDATEDDEVDWLTSHGDISDVDDPVAHLVVDEPGPVTIVAVLRDGLGGVAWQVATLDVR